MRCYYDLLEISRDATDDDIKKAYRKLALRWHPDKNPDNVDECTRQFALIQEANEKLSDHQERAWYDRHREQILKGGFDEDFVDTAVNLFPFFRPSTYRGFGEDPKSFYSVYREVFETISREDEPFMENPSDMSKIPTFGRASSDYDTVVAPFYAHWMAYNTLRSYAWVEKYDIRQAPNRPTLRAMEKDNAKIRQNARRERNELVQELVAYVRKHDPRVAANRVRQEEERQAAMKRATEHRREQILQRAGAADDYVPGEWENANHRDDLDAIEQEHASSSDMDSDEEDSPDVNALYCIACERAFKKAGQLANHEKSKKHKEKLAELRQLMHDEDVEMFGDEVDEVEEVAQPKRKGKKKKKKKAALPSSSDEEQNQIDEPARPPMTNEPTVADVTAGVESVAVVDGAEAEPTPAPNTSTKPKTTGKKSVWDDSSSDDEQYVEVEPEASPAPPTTPKVPPTTDAASRTCDKCKVVFESRSKLFDHLKSSGHATLIKTKPVKTNAKAKQVVYVSASESDDNDFEIRRGKGKKGKKRR